MRSNGKTWKEVSDFFDIPSTTCIEHYNKLVTKTTVWDEDMDHKLEKAYQQGREEMWTGVAQRVGVPWRAAEDRVWDLGKKKFVKK